MNKANLQKKFIFAILSSWSLAFIGVIFAKYINIANSKILIYTLLASGATTPFQLFFNECIAPVEALNKNGTTKIPNKPFFLGIFFQAIAIITFLKDSLSNHEIAIFITFFSFGSYFSFQYVKNYYKLLRINLLSEHKNIILSSLPGITVILVYGISAFLNKIEFQHWESILYLNAILPQMAQLLTLSIFTRKLEFINLDSQKDNDHHNLFKSLLYLVALMIASTILINSRNEIAKSSTDSMAVLIVSLNALGTIINTITRASFLSSTNKSKNNSSKFTLILASLTLSIAVFFYIGINISIISMIFALFSVSSIIEYARRNF